MNVEPLTPLTSLSILKNVPLDNSYKDTITFSNVGAQYNYFISKTKYTVSNMSPVRMQNKIRVPYVADDLYDCNYIMFRNANFSNKNFYAFITGIEFINTEMSLISFEIDVLQTWMFDYTLKPCFIEREHTNDDTIGSNIESEPVSISDYVSISNSISGVLNRKFSVAIYYLKDNNGLTAGVFEGKNYSGLQKSVIPIDFDDLPGTRRIVNAMIENAMNTGQTLGNDPDNIVSIQIVPENFCGNNSTLTGNSEMGYHTTWNIPRPVSVDGYIPKNNKLFTYPFSFLTVYTGENSNDYKWELFSNDNIYFKIVGNNSTKPEVICYPLVYKGISENINERLTIGNFPVCTWSSDMFKAWLAQSASSMGISALASGIAALAMPSPLTVGAAAMTAAKAAGDVSSHSTMSASAHNGNGGSALYTDGNIEFHYSAQSIRSEEAEKIDNFFSMYGYAVNDVKMPNVTGRQSWNYVKTRDSKIVGSIPFDDISKIRQIYDGGVTFWHGDYVGDYSRSNNIVV